MTSRSYSSKRMKIVEALAEKLMMIDGQGAFLSDVADNVFPRLKFWDEVEEFPAIHLNAGSETREYQTGGYKNRFLFVTIRIYVQEEESQEALGALLEDVETVLEDNSQLEYLDNVGISQNIQQI